MKKDIKILSEGKQLENAILNKFGENGVSVVAEIIDRKASTIQQYINDGKFKPHAESTVKRIIELIGDGFEILNKNQQIEILVNHLEDNFDRHASNHEVYEKLAVLAEEATGYYLKTRARILMISAKVVLDPNAAIAMLEEEMKSTDLDEKLKALIYKEIANAYYYSGDFNACNKNIKKAKCYAPLNDNLRARIFHLSGLCLWSIERYRHAEDDLKVALEMYGNDEIKSCYIMNILGMIKIKCNKKKRARTIYKEAIEIAEKIGDLDLLLVLYNNSFDAWDDDPNQAALFAKKAIEIVERGAGYCKSRQIAKNNLLRLAIMTNNDDEVKRLAKEHSGMVSLSYSEAAVVAKSLAQNIKSSNNFKPYAKEVLWRIIKISDAEMDLEKKKQIQQFYAILSSEIFLGVEEYEEI